MKKFFIRLSVCVLALISTLMFVACSKTDKNDKEQEAKIYVEMIILNKQELSLEVDECEDLSVKIFPENATDKTVTWFSTNSSVAEVSDGKVKAVSAGKAVITATADGVSNSCTVTVTSSLISMRDIDVKPTQTAAYEQYSKQALDDYFAVANQHKSDDGDIDYTNKEVVAAASTAAAKLFAYACYNERRLDQYAYFSSQEGDTEISSGSATAMRQEYNLRINKSEENCGYQYRSTIKKVMGCDGTIEMAKDLFEQGRTRIVVNTDELYRLEGSNFKVGGRDDVLEENILKADWEKGSDWGVKDNTRLVKGEYIEPENIKADIEQHAGEDNVTIRANINILAPDIIKNVYVLKEESEAGLEGYLLVMTIDTEVANRDEASLKMLRLANGSNDCTWDSEEGFSIVCRLWKNGLFRAYSVTEKLQGTISGFSGAQVTTSTTYHYSYSDRDCDMTKYLEMLEQLKKY